MILINLCFIKVDISSVIGYILSVKAENEITLMKKASLSSVEMFTKYLKDQIMEIIDSDKVYPLLIVFRYFISIFMHYKISVYLFRKLNMQNWLKV